MTHAEMNPDTTEEKLAEWVLMKFKSFTCLTISVQQEREVILKALELFIADDEVTS